MCIRDRHYDAPGVILDRLIHAEVGDVAEADLAKVQSGICLLYTSDAADERSSVDLGGSRIIQNKKTSALVQQTQPYLYSHY